MKKKLEDTNGVRRRRKLMKVRSYNGEKENKTKEQILVYKILHRKPKIEQHEPQK
jgi:hypothetical protein